ncbi:putative protein FAM10A4 [Diorhabda sublineata]|uniref:putative protein FAM10A4 n=1 Tax=Diorhabda sublineata TaxID=1163346 RepID=UPI0024E089C5|nr:putative protein FAM10A4 [Diorhabda sublineata]
MSCPISKEAVDKLKQFISICKTTPDIIHIPELSFFKDYLESLGAKLPESKKMPSSSGVKAEPAEVHDEPIEDEAIASDPESVLEFDMTGCVEPDKLDDDQKMGDPTKEITEEMSDKADELRIQAMSQLSEGNTEKAIELFTEAIQNNPSSALLFAKRGQAYLKLTRPNACIRDCTRALELNCDSAPAYKFRGRAYRLLGEWELAAKDLRQACNIDFDEQTDEWLKEVTPNAKRIEEHLLKKERRKKDKEERERLDRIRKAREAHAKAAAKEEKDETNEAGDGGDFYKLLQDPEIMAAFQDPEVAAAFKDISMNPGNFMKYQSNPKVMNLVSKLSSKISGSGMNFPGFSGAGFPGAGFPGAGGAGFPGFPGGFPGAGTGTTPKPDHVQPDDDNLD